MKVAITSTGNSLEAGIDKRFGRCAYFVIWDTKSKSVEFIPNPFRDIEEGSGTAAVQIIGSRGVHKIISGEFGMKIKPLLESMKIQMIVFKQPGIKIWDIIKYLNH